MAVTPFISSDDFNMSNFNSKIAQMNDGFAKKLGGAKIASGNYTGTGTYGVDSFCSLEFNFMPYYVVITQFYPSSGLSSTAYFLPLVLTNSYSNYACKEDWGTTEAQQFKARILINNTQDGTKLATLQWYSTKNAAWQLNDEGANFSYFAIGE